VEANARGFALAKKRKNVGSWLTSSGFRARFLLGRAKAGRVFFGKKDRKVPRRGVDSFRGL